MKRCLEMLLFFLMCHSIQAQVVVHGVVEDSATLKPVAGAFVTLMHHGQPLTFVHSNGRGEFFIRIPVLQREDSLQVTSIGYARKKVEVEKNGSMRILMPAKAFELNEVQVRGGCIFGKQDTITYDLARFASERDNSLKDILKKLPGVEVDADGRLQVNGKALQRFTVEGLDLTGGRYNQLEENIKAKDVKKAQVIEHDQPVKILQDKVVTDAVAMNILLKDEARDRLLLTLKPYLMVGEPVHAGGSANVLQIGQKRQWMYDAAYDRTGKDLAGEIQVLAAGRDGLSAVRLPSWLAVPSVAAPIDAGRLRMNTSQGYSVSRIQKTKNDSELRLAIHYLHSLERQETENESVYHLGGLSSVKTLERKHLTLKSDEFVAELEHKVNSQLAYGEDLLQISALRPDGLSALGDTLSQRICAPEINIAGNICRLLTLGKGQLSLRSVFDGHCSVSDLSVNGQRERLRTNLWHTGVSAGWLHKQTNFTSEYTAGFETQNLHVAAGNMKIAVSFIPYWQYEKGLFRGSLTARVSWEHFTRQRQSFLLWSPLLCLNGKTGSHGEWTFSGSYKERTGDMDEFAVESYRRDYRSYFTGSSIIPRKHTLLYTLDYQYRRPVIELFANVDLTAECCWANVLDDFQIKEGRYYTSVIAHGMHSRFRQVEAAVSKGFYDLHLKVRLGGSYAYHRGEQLSADHLLRYRSNIYRLMPDIEFTPSWGAVSYQAEFRWYSSSADNKLFDWKQNLSLTSTIGPVDLTCAIVHYRNEIQDGKALKALIADTKAVWKMKKFRFTVALNNLFNRRKYMVTQFSGVSVLTDDYILRGRELLVSVQYSL